MEKKLVKILETVGAIAMAVLTITILWQVITRELFHVSATWTVEICRAMFTVIVFIGAPICISEGTHLTVTMVKDGLKKNKVGTLIFDIIGDVIIYFVLITLTYGCYAKMISEWKSMVPTVEWLSYGYVYAAMFFGTLAMVFMQVRNTVKYVKRFKGESIEGEEEKK